MKFKRDWLWVRDPATHTLTCDECRGSFPAFRGRTDRMVEQWFQTHDCIDED